MKHKFKAGDKVRCIDTSGLSEPHDLKLNSVYTVYSIPDYETVLIYLEDVGGWNFWRFELVQEDQTTQQEPLTLSVENTEYIALTVDTPWEIVVQSFKNLGFELYVTTEKEVK